MSRTMAFGQSAIVGAAMLLLTACGGGGINATAPVTVQQACANLQGKTISGAIVFKTVALAANAGVPAYCEVTALIEPKLTFELRLPEAWNGKLHYGGGGGYDGSIPDLSGANLNALSRGYANVSSDGGHQANVLDASWALNDPLAAQLFGSFSVPTVMAAATSMVRSVYGAAPTRSYFEGCSGGGREALSAAQRFPALFDGIIARAPAYNWTGLMGAFNRVAKAAAAPGGQFSAAKVATLAKAVRSACDGDDGIVDGVVSNPAACAFNPAVLRCAAGADTGTNCLSDAQLAVVGARTSTSVFSGTAPYRNAGWNLSGNEDEPDGWAVWVTADGNVKSGLQYLFQDTTVKTYLARNLGADSLLYIPFDRDKAALDLLATLNDATNSNLGGFSARGGKLILWHGGSDPALSVNATSEYYNGVVASMGGQAAADAFVRYYVAPGVNHCSGGPGADDADLLGALEAWVEKSTPPGTLTANKLDAGAIAFSRPLCPYPKYPRYTGPANDAAAAKLASSYFCS
ncbi:MAG: tannase/feruloyl esterase family alpha/beta hydrolase [Bacteriovorax sp.]|nr:tannase/feruloyl esterase family alpha/beta hydrolase [Rhizobacter sp.]